jgi:hypothetical protein
MKPLYPTSHTVSASRLIELPRCAMRLGVEFGDNPG